jgi:putative sporulation protein YtaF
MKGIHMPLRSLGVVGVVTVICVSIAMLGTHALGQFVDVHIAILSGASLLIALGVYRLLLDYLTKDVAMHEPGHHHPAIPRKLTFSIGALVFRIMVKPEAADLDRSRHISPAEALLLGLALGIDNMVAATAASLGGLLPIYAPLAMGVVQASLLAAGIYGCEWLIDHRVRFRLPYVSGTILITLGLARLI